MQVAHEPSSVVSCDLASKAPKSAQTLYLCSVPLAVNARYAYYMTKTVMNTYIAL